jgi:hypothetical protein
MMMCAYTMYVKVLVAAHVHTCVHFKQTCTWTGEYICMTTHMTTMPCAGAAM